MAWVQTAQHRAGHRYCRLMDEAKPIINSALRNHDADYMRILGWEIPPENLNETAPSNSGEPNDNKKRRQSERTESK